MLRIFIAGGAALALVFGFVPELLAQNATPWPVDTGPYFTTGPNALQRGPGLYVDLVKLLLTFGLFVGWIGVADWINRDAQENKEDVRFWNHMVFFSVFGALAAVWLLPWFWAGFPLLVLAAVTPPILYIRTRNKKLHSNDQVMTRGHIRYWLSEKLKPLGIKIAAEPRGPVEAPVTFVIKGGKTDRDNNVYLLTAKQSPGYLPCAKLLADAIEHRALAVMVELTPDTAKVRYMIDTIWTDAALGPKTKDPAKDRDRDRAQAEGILAVLKTVSALNAEEHEARQRGSFAVTKGKDKFTCRFTCQGAKNMERGRVRFDDGAPHKTRLGTIGMRKQSQDAIQEVLSLPEPGQPVTGKMIVVSAPNGGGLSSLLNATVAGVDRYLRSVMALEDATNLDVLVENVQVMSYDPAANETAEATFIKVTRQYPDVIVLPDLASGDLGGELCAQATDENRLVITSLRAQDTADSLLRVLALKTSRQEFAAAISAAIHGRVLRKLCDTCKEAYPPPDKIAKQLGPRLLDPLGMTAEQVESFYRPPEPPTDPKKKKPPPCPDCKGVGYRGLTSLYEVLIVDDSVREALASEPKLETVRQAARKAGMFTLQEEGLMLVVKGVTSLNELMRVLQGDKE